MASGEPNAQTNCQIIATKRQPDAPAMQCTIDSLPDEILEYILCLIPPYKDLRECMFVSKRWCRITKNVIDRNDAHFRKSVAVGTLFWNSWSYSHWSPMIGKRHSHSACIFENSMYVFGGCTATSTAFNDLWKLDLDTREWIRPITMGNYPSPKAYASMVCYKKNFILFGGWSQPSSYSLYQQLKVFNELHAYSIESNRWSVIENVPESPPPISAHSASIHKNMMVVFGGITALEEYNSTNDVWCLNLDTYCWHKQRTNEVQPTSRYGQSQIEIDDTHLLIIGGCTGPNCSINDVWLLTMEGPIWQWRKVNILNAENAPKKILCHQACKAGNHVVVLGKKQQKSQPRDMSILLPKLNSRRTVPEVNNAYERSNKTPPIDRDENVNGRHGVFPRSQRRSLEKTPPPSHPVIPKSLSVFNDNTLSMAAFRDKALPKARSIANRQRALDSIRKMEEKLQSQRAPLKPPSVNEPLAIYILDISNVLRDDCTASWVPWKQTNQTGPDERILYSLVLGKGELIVFGGIRNEKVTIQGQTVLDESEVYNDLHFINPPKYNI